MHNQTNPTLDNDSTLTGICLGVDDETLAIFKAHAQMIGENYQSLMQRALKQFASNLRQEDEWDETIRQEDA